MSTWSEAGGMGNGGGMGRKGGEASLSSTSVPRAHLLSGTRRIGCLTPYTVWYHNDPS